MYNYNPTGSSTNYGDYNPAVLALQQSLNARGAQLKLDGKLGPKTQAAMRTYLGTSATDTDAQLKAAIQGDPSLAGYNADDLVTAFNTNNWSGLTTPAGKPFDPSVANAELDRQMSILDPYFKQDLAKGTEDVTRALGQDQADFQNYLDTSATSFASDKAAQDKEAADNGVLFSSGRVAKLNNLGTAYAQDALYKQKKVGNDIGALASDFQYKYGNDPTQNLSSYFKLGGQNYNPFVARGGTTPTNVSTVYRPSLNNYFGTNNTLQRTQAIQRASGVLANKANKLLPNSYAYQY